MQIIKYFIKELTKGLLYITAILFLIYTILRLMWMYLSFLDKTFGQPTMWILVGISIMLVGATCGALIKTVEKYKEQINK